MNKQTPGDRLKAARKMADMKQAQVARLTGISQSRLSALESGRRPCSVDEWLRLRACLPLGPLDLPEKLVLPTPRPMWRATAPERTTSGQCAPSVREFAAKKSFGQLAVQAGAQAARLHNPALIAKFFSDAGLDSGHEHRFWTQLMAEGGAPCWFRPLKAGFEDLCVVQRETKKNLSDRRLPCLDVAGKTWDWLLWPQVTIDARQAYYRLDALAKVQRNGESHWLNLEIDGEGHDSEFDHRRARHLGLPTVRLKRAELALPNAFKVLESKVADLLDQTKAG
jgi:DNA-binding XRE family transcriptional regulator